MKLKCKLNKDHCKNFYIDSDRNSLIEHITLFIFLKILFAKGSAKDRHTSKDI